MSNEFPECRSDMENAPEKIFDPDSSSRNPDEVCPVCSSLLLPGEETIICPDCKMAYHRACWNENNGCATYGCSSAGCLNPASLKIDGKETAGGATGKMVCPHCGIPRAPDATFCWSCGRDLTEKEKTEKQEDRKWDPFHPEKLWRTNKWWAIAGICFLLARYDTRSKRRADSITFLLLVIAIVTGIIGYIIHIRWKNIRWKNFIWGLQVTVMSVVTILIILVLYSCTRYWP